jgi:tRNA(Ile)-lysidine synthase
MVSDLPQTATGPQQDAGIHPFEDQVEQHWPARLWADANVLVAVSGGPDSVALLRALLRLAPPGQGRLRAAHVNHGLRPGECDREETFVRELCRQLGVTCHVRRIEPDDSSGRRTDGREGSARHVRYRELAAVASETSARFLVTAHTADDQAETILHRVIRGTGLKGLGGIPRTRRFGPHCVLLRPLLSLRRTQVLQYLADLGQAFCCDRSNDDLSYTRNAIRHELIPLLASRYNRHITEALLRLGKLAKENDAAVESLLVRIERRAVDLSDDGSAAIDLRRLGRLDAYLKRELIRHVWIRRHWPLQKMGYAQWQRLESVIESPGTPCKLVLPGNVVASFDGRVLTMRRSV